MFQCRFSEMYGQCVSQDALKLLCPFPFHPSLSLSLSLSRLGRPLMLIWLIGRINFVIISSQIITERCDGRTDRPRNPKS